MPSLEYNLRVVSEVLVLSIKLLGLPSPSAGLVTRDTRIHKHINITISTTMNKLIRFFTRTSDVRFFVKKIFFINL